MKKEGFVLILLLGVVFSFTNVNALTLQEECNNFCASAPYALDNCVGGNEFNSWSYRYGYHKRSQTYAMLDESGNIDTIGDFLCDCSVQGNDGELVSCDPVVAYDAATDSPILDRNGFLCNVLLGYNIFATRGYCKPANVFTQTPASCKNFKQIPQQDIKCFVYVYDRSRFNDPISTRNYLLSDCIYDYWGGYPNILLNGPSSNYKNTSLKNYLDRYQDPGAFPYDSRCNPDGDGCYEYLDYAISEAFGQCERGEHQCPGNVHPNICQSEKNITKYVCIQYDYLGSYSSEPSRCDIPTCRDECGSGIQMNPDHCFYYDASCIETFDGSHCGAKNVVDLDTDQQLCESTCPYDPADPSISAPLKWAASGVNQQFGEYSRIGQVACCGDDPDEVVATSATITRCCMPNQRVDSNGNCYYDFGGATCTDTDSTTYPTVNRDLRGTASSGTNSFTDTCEPPPSTSVREYYCQTPSDTQVLSVVYPCLNPCLNGQCAAPVFCKLINAYWTKDYTKPSSPSPWRVLNNSDTALVLIGEDCPTTLSVNFSIWESDCTGSITLDNNGVPTCSGGITLKKGTSSIINFDSTGKTFVNWRTTTEADNDNNYIDADGFDSNEYYFVAHLINSLQSNLSQMLIVNSTPDPDNPPGDGISGNCGNQQIESYELCDPTADPTGCPSGWVCNIMRCDSCTVVSGGVRTVLIKSPCLEDSNPGDQFGVYHETTIKYDITTGAKISEVTGPDKQCLLSGKIKVPFFDWINFIVVIALIVGFYIVQHYRRNKNN